jgi:hypothetical protein
VRAQGDLLSLLRAPLVCGGSAGQSLVAVTVSQRGSPKLYEDDLVDTLVALVRHLALAHGFSARAAGVCRYTISAPMYTVAFVLSKGDAADTHHTATSGTCHDFRQVPGPDGGRRLLYMPGDWSLLRGLAARGRLQGCARGRFVLAVLQNPLAGV